MNYDTKTVQNIAIIGSSGAIGGALACHLAVRHPNAVIHAFSRHGFGPAVQNIVCAPLNYSDESSIETAAMLASRDVPLDMVIIATGLLHDRHMKPEKSLRSISAENFRRVFEANTFFPALIAKHFLPRLNCEMRAIFAAISARVGSISDNRLGGWYAYRASKAALNMVIKNAAIEMARCNKKAIIVGLHPGTVKSGLSQPFQENVPDGHLFTPDFSAIKLIDMLSNLTFEQSGRCFAWNGKEILP